jgi:hypothetical protein
VVKYLPPSKLFLFPCEFVSAFTHLQNLFLASGNAELSYEMALTTINQKVFIKTFYTSARSCAAVRQSSSVFYSGGTIQ